MSDKKTTISRRKMLRSTATAIAAAPLIQKKSLPQKTAPTKFFTPAEFALVDELTEIIIPTDEHSPGARAAKVAAYIDARLAEAFTNEPRELWRSGLTAIEKLSQELHRKPFLKSSETERATVVARIAQGERNPQTSAEKFFVELKSRTAHAYYTSQIGIHQDIQYKGNVYLKEYVGESVN